MCDLLSKYIQAFGMLTTLKGDMQIDALDPEGMAQELLEHLRPKCVKGTLDLGLVDSFGTSGDGPKKLVAVARYPTNLTDFLSYDVIKFHVESGDTYEYEGIHIHSVEYHLMHNDRVVYTFTFDYLPVDDGTLDLGTFDRYIITDLSHGGDYSLELTRIKSDRVKDVVMAKVKTIAFSTTGGKTFRFQVDSMRYIHQRSNKVRVTFYGKRIP